MIEVPDQPVFIRHIGIVSGAVLSPGRVRGHQRIIILAPVSRIQNIASHPGLQQTDRVGRVHRSRGIGHHQLSVLFQCIWPFHHISMVILPSILRFCNADRIGYKFPRFLLINLCQIQPCTLIHRKELPLRPHCVASSLISKHGHIKGNDFAFFAQRSTVLFHYHDRFGPVLPAHGITALSEPSHTGFLTVEFSRCCRMEHIKLSAYFMEFRSPEKPPYSRISIRIQKQGFPGCYDSFQCIRASHVKRMVIIRVVCCNEIIFAVSVHADRIRAVFCKRRRKMFLMDSSLYNPSRRLFPVDLSLYPGSVTVRSDSLHGFQFLFVPERAVLRQHHPDTDGNCQLLKQIVSCFRRDIDHIPRDDALYG